MWGALIVLTLLKSWVWIGIFPVWKIADEPAHFDNIQYRAERGHAPTPTGVAIDPVIGPGVSSELRRSWTVTQHYWRDRFLPGTRVVPEEGELAELGRHDEARLGDGQMPAMSYPALFYQLGVVPYLAFHHSSIVTRAFAVRVMSMLFGLLAVLCTFAAARRVLDDVWLAFAAALLVSLQPAESMQTAAINNDAALVGLSALVLYLELRILMTWPAAASVRDFALFGGAAGLALLTKPQAVALLPGCAVVAWVGSYRFRRERATWLRLGAAAAAFLPLAAVAAVELRASVRAWATVNQATRPHVAAAVHDGIFAWLWHAYPSFYRYLDWQLWGRFGWMEFGFSRDWLDWLGNVMVAVACALVVAVALRMARLQSPWWSARGLGFLVGTLAVMSGFICYTEYRAETLLGVAGVVQGRGLLYALPAFAIIVVVAFGSLVPARLRRSVAAILVSCVALVNVGALVAIARYHYGH